MNEYSKLIDVATQTDAPPAFISAVLAYAKSVQDSDQTPELAADLPAKAIP